ncbi:TPA: hypothetical protein GHF72_07880 [Providencia stuartii]|uniref:Uncharacterized protein n=2 Tax=Providencia stuartii TaxID=588 RepID=A0AA86Z3U2_PROST|nr:hypothetical protein S70_10755 [Providencia stuartii MRSN 2154]AMG67647.1 hypothetical protein AL507_14215 [Providencia stuartii]EDU61572.1 hypothetical protein PROSTU_00461 [Providencia stuartii ATCC 25827]APG51951.1 hypothetical protein BGK56_13685 [Providencia stuartii]AVE41718.1 hypothetical protein AM353_07585 [Providencia stuartii]
MSILQKSNQLELFCSGYGRLVRLRSPSQQTLLTEKNVIILVKKFTEIGSSRQTQDPQRWRSIRFQSFSLKPNAAKVVIF